MNEKKSDRLLIIRLTVVLFFFALLAFPLSLMALDGPDETEMESEASTSLMDLTLDNYLEGTFQNAFSSWFSGHYPLRSRIVTAYKQFRFKLENAKWLSDSVAFLNGSLWAEDEPTPTPIPTSVPTDPDDPNPTEKPEDNPLAKYLAEDNIYAEINQQQLMEAKVEPSGFHGNDAVYVGKSGYLFEKGYMDEYYGYTNTFTTEQMRENLALTVERLEYIQSELEKRGITMLYIISSSKGSQYADYIPNWYKNMNIEPEDYVRPVDVLRPLLAESSLHYLDSSEYYKEIGLLVTFPKTGIHWNLLASGESTAKLLDMYAELTGNEIRQFNITGFESQSSPYNFGNPEQDVYNILYGAMPAYKSESIVDTAYYKPIIEVLNDDTAPTYNIFIQGGSFCQGIMPFITSYGVGTVTHIYYNGLYSFCPIDSANIWENGVEEWAKWLEDKDIVIFETTESAIPLVHSDGLSWQEASTACGHNAIYDSLYEYLKNHEGEY